jgi:hypothetical protein
MSPVAFPAATLMPPEWPVPDTFTEVEFAGLPEPVCRYLANALAPGVSLHGSVRIDVRGHLRRHLWVPFRARYELTDRLDFFGLGSAGELVAGGERYAAGVATRQARLAGILPMREDTGRDLSRSAAGRAALAAVMLPTALLPRFGVTWTTGDDGQIQAAFRVHNVPVTLRLRIDGDGRPLAAIVNRWGDPDGTGVWGSFPFGAVFTEETSSDGLTVPSAGRAGWFADTDRWDDGQVLRFRVTAVHRIDDREPVALAA